MKKLLASFLFAAALFTGACDTEKETPFNTEIGYAGTLSMTSNDDPTRKHSFDNVSFELKNADDGTLTMMIYNMQFPGMPMAIDMIFPGIGFRPADGGVTLAAAQLIPYYGSRPMNDRKVTDLQGTATDSRLTLSFVCMNYHVAYTGTKKN